MNYELTKVYSREVFMISDYDHRLILSTHFPIAKEVAMSKAIFEDSEAEALTNFDSIILRNNTVVE